jgi:hypothetical protein
MQDENTDRPTDTGMLGSDADNPGPGRDTHQTDPDPAATSSEHPTRTVGMSGADPERTRLGTQETSGRPLAGAPQDTTSSGQADTGMVGSETENPGRVATRAGPTPPLPPAPRIRRQPRPCPTPTLPAPGSAATSLALPSSNNSPLSDEGGRRAGSPSAPDRHRDQDLLRRQRGVASGSTWLPAGTDPGCRTGRLVGV